MLQNLHVLLTFDKVQNPLRLPGETASERPNALRTCQFFTLVTSQCASRHKGVHFFDISTSKRAPNPLFFLHFWLRNISKCASRHNGVHFFRHLNFQKWSQHGVFWCVLDILTWKCASRHNGVHFFNISTSKRGPNMVCFVHFDLEMRFAPQRRATSLITWLHTRRFREPTYFSTLQSHKKLEKHSVSRLSYLFARLHLLSSDSFSFNDSSHLCFSICPYCRKFDF